MSYNTLPDGESSVIKLHGSYKDDESVSSEDKNQGDEMSDEIRDVTVSRSENLLPNGALHIIFFFLHLKKKKYIY